MSEWPNWWMLPLAKTIDCGVDTACGCNCHCLSLWFISVAGVCSGFGMVAWAFGLWLGVGRYSRPLRGVGVLAMPDVILDTTWHVNSTCDIPPGAGVLRLLVPSVVVGECIDHRCVLDGMEVKCWVISAVPKLFSKDEGVEFWPWIVVAVEPPPREEYLLPARVETLLLAWGSRDFPEGPPFCCFWRFRTTRVMSGWVLWEGIARYRCSKWRM